MKDDEVYWTLPQVMGWIVSRDNVHVNALEEIRPWEEEGAAVTIAEGWQEQQRLGLTDEDVLVALGELRSLARNGQLSICGYPAADKTQSLQQMPPHLWIDHTIDFDGARSYRTLRIEWTPLRFRRADIVSAWPCHSVDAADVPPATPEQMAEMLRRPLWAGGAVVYPPMPSQNSSAHAITGKARGRRKGQGAIDDSAVLQTIHREIDSGETVHRACEMMTAGMSDKDAAAAIRRWTRKVKGGLGH